jgi:hypothetical protein
VRPHGIADLARIRALRLTDRLDDDVRRWQRARFFGEPATERFHELVVDFLAAEFSQQTTHFRDVLFVTPPLLGALLQHRGAGRRPARTWRSARTRRTHAWASRTRTHWTLRPRPAWCATWSLASSATWHWSSELGLELTPTTSSARTWATRWTSSLTAKLFAAMLASGRTTASVAVEPILIEIVGFEIAINSFAAGTRRSTAWCRFDNHQRRFVLLGHFRWREPGLLQRGILAEQRFLQRPSHTLSLLTLK